MAVLAGPPKPDIGTVDAFRNAVVSAKSIAYLRVGSGTYLASLFEESSVAGPQSTPTLTLMPDTSY